jgi:transposase InsO family protein
MFARNGIPDQIVSDNGPQFIAAEFSVFVNNNGIKHIRSAPYHPAANGLAERFIQTFKQGMRASKSNKSISSFCWLTVRLLIQLQVSRHPCCLWEETYVQS